MDNGFRSEQLFRRKFPRRKFRRNVGVLIRGAYQLTSGNEIGEGGIAFNSSEEFEVGQMLLVNFHIPHRGYFSIRSEIRNKRPVAEGFLYGCAFHDLKFEAKREIRTFVTARSVHEQ